MREHKTADLVVGIVAAVLIFAAVPAALLVLVGLPDPIRAGDAHFWSGHHGFDGLGVVAWVAWAACCGPLLAAVVRKVRRRDVVATGRAPTPEWLASRIAAAVLIVGSVTLSTGAIAGAAGHGGAIARPHPTLSVPAPAPPATTIPASVPSTAPPAPSAGATVPASVPPGPGTTTTETAPVNPGTPVRYTVEAGDSLWSIAERFYDDGSEWSAIAQANLGQTMDDGTRFVDPSLIQPGWVLTLPADPTAAPATSGPATSGPATSAMTTASSPATPATSATATSARPPMGPPEHSGLNAGPIAPTATHRAAGGDRGRRGTERRRGRKPAGSPGPIPLPELAALGVGVVLAAAMARRARRMRHLASSTRSEGEVTVDLSEAAAGTAADLVPFEDAPVLAWLETANRHLADALNASGRADGAPAARLVRVGSDGVEVRLRQSVGWAPPGWVLEKEGSSWRLPASLELADVGRGSHRSTPWLPVLLPVGTNDDGTWLVPIGPGDCVPVIGPEADALVRTMRVAVESWAWSELVTVTDDPSQVPDDPSASAAGPPVEATLTVVYWPEDGPPRPRVLFVGDPASLSASAAARCSVVTTLPVTATDLTVTVDATAASLHPLGVTVRPDLLDLDRQAAVSE
ncbi:MAG TPA: LysM peptidoglycan-binding domain-containing protein, partial [Acidimicrobiales bacterium]